MSALPKVSAFICTNIGQVDDGVTIERKRNTDGSFYFRASTVITNIFGSDLRDGAPTIEGFGVSEEQARERLSVELRKFNDSLWF